VPLFGLCCRFLQSCCHAMPPYDSIIGPIVAYCTRQRLPKTSFTLNRTCQRCLKCTPKNCRTHTALSFLSIPKSKERRDEGVLIPISSFSPAALRVSSPPNSVHWRSLLVPGHIRRPSVRLVRRRALESRHGARRRRRVRASVERLRRHRGDLDRHLPGLVVAGGGASVRRAGSRDAVRRRGRAGHGGRAAVRLVLLRRGRVGRDGRGLHVRGLRGRRAVPLVPVLRRLDLLVRLALAAAAALVRLREDPDEEGDLDGLPQHAAEAEAGDLAALLTAVFCRRKLARGPDLGPWEGGDGNIPLMMLMSSAHQNRNAMTDNTIVRIQSHSGQRYE
jgi:hypothetical protein